MRNSKTVILFLLLILVFTAAGCKANTEPSVTPETLPSAPAASPSDSAPDVEPTIEPAAVISVDYATDELLADFDAYDVVAEPEAGAQKIIFTTSAAVKNFRFITIGYEEVNEELCFFEEKELYSQPELTPERPMVVTWMEQGTIPHRAIAYVDESGTEKYFYIAMSGEDGSVFISEFAPLNKNRLLSSSLAGKMLK